MSAPTVIQIVGGGLAGLSLGLGLRREGVPAIVFEAGDYPRHRVCGEFISGLANHTIARLGLAPLLQDAVRNTETAWFVNEKCVGIYRLPAPAFGISRHALDARLATAFVTAGGQLHTRSRFADPVDSPGRVFANGRRRAAQSRWIGLKIHAGALPLIRDVEMHLGDECYIGLSRVEDGAINICGLFPRGNIAGRGATGLIGYVVAAGLPVLARRLAGANFDRKSFCAIAAFEFDRRTNACDRVCLGDACAMIPPFTGNGMAMAFQSAELALDPLVAFAHGKADWRQTCRATNAALRSRFRLRLASADALHPFLLRPWQQRWFGALTRARLLPFRLMFAALR